MYASKMITHASKTIGMTLVALCIGVLAGCGSPFAGGWSGTMDVGPFLAHTVTVQMPPEGLEGDLVVKTVNGERSYRICKGDLKGTTFSLTFDLKHPDCAAAKDAKTDRHVLKGTLGESVLFGEIFREGRRIGFFRAYRKPPPVEVKNG